MKETMMWIAIAVVSLAIAVGYLAAVNTLQNRDIRAIQTKMAALRVRRDVDRLQFNSLWEKVYGYKIPSAIDLATDAPVVPIEAGPKALDAIREGQVWRRKKTGELTTVAHVSGLVDLITVPAFPGSDKPLDRHIVISFGTKAFLHTFEFVSEEAADEVQDAVSAADIAQDILDTHEAIARGEVYGGQIEVGQVWEDVARTGKLVTVVATPRAQNGTQYIDYKMSGESGIDTLVDSFFLDRFRWVSNGEMNQ